MGSNLPLIVVQYELQGHPRRTEHWALAAIDISEDSAQLFQVKGTPATFEFDTPKHYAIDKSKRYLGGVLVGYIAKNNLETLSQWLQAVPVQHNRNDWDCQNWVIEALQELWMEGRQVVLEGRASERFIRQQLAKEKEFEETGQDMIYERLKSGFGQ